MSKLMSLITILVLSVLAHAESDPDYSVVGLEPVMKWAANRNDRAAKEFSGVRYPSPKNWAQEVVYQVMVDRFNDGNPHNNKLNIEDFQRRYQDNTQVGVASYRHGGDIAGITKRLDYLADLGVTSLWITPILKSQGSYHGYCLQDPTQIDPGFGTNAEFRQMVAEAHKRGIKIILDIVINHLCDPETEYETEFNQQNYNLCLNDLGSKQYLGFPEQPRGQRKLKFSARFFKPLKSQYFFSRCGYKPGDFTASGATAVFGDFSSSMLDLDTTNWDLQKIFTEIHKYWVAYADVDGFRLDAAKHVTHDFVAYFSTHMRAYAESLGKKNFYIIGEVADSASHSASFVGKMKMSNDFTPANDHLPKGLRDQLGYIQSVYKKHAAFPYPGLNAVYDFSHSGRMLNVFAEFGSPLNIKKWFWSGGETENITCGSEFCELAQNGDSRINWNLLEIHDWPRFLLHDRPNLFSALGYLMMTQGVPVLYYGMEQGLNGRCQMGGSTVTDAEARKQVEHICFSSDVHNHERYRQDMFVSGSWKLGSVIPDIQKLSSIGRHSQNGPENWTDDPFLNRNHDLYRFIRQLAHIRSTCKSIGEGAIYFRAAHAEQGLLAFSRILDNQEIVLVVNNSGHRVDLSEIRIDAGLHSHLLGRKYINLLNSSETGIVIDAEGGGRKLQLKSPFGAFSLREHSVAIFALEDQIQKSGPLLICR